MIFQKQLFQRLGALLSVLLFLLGCSGATSVASRQATSTIPVQVSSSPMRGAQVCAGSFITHLLDHTTIASTKLVTLYESNGSGVAINDLDADGDLDIVLANLGALNSILWNEGALNFRTQRLAHGASRAVAIVDVEGDGWLDIVFTRRFNKPTYWRNTGQTGDGRFVEGRLPDVHNPFYSMAWGDLDRDGDLDLVAGSYDTEIRKEKGGIFDYQGGGVGVFLYTQADGHFLAQRLADQADALAIALPDLNGDGQQDILVGNDFNRPDAAWLRSDAGWTTTQPFRRSTENTMSLDLGDIDNDGSSEIFATDMKPYRKDVTTLAQWLPMMDKMTHPTSSGDPQRTENMLYVRRNGRLQNLAYQRQIDATGWSWSSKFGDLDQDGFLDIYVVNGMIAAGLFDHLPNAELVEENRALRNDGGGNFTLATEWGLGSTASGRGMSMGDLDGDGDLDIVVNNLQSPAQLFENRLCGGSSVAVDLRWPGGKNPYAIGAQVVLHTSAGSYYRTVQVGSGYLSGDPTRVHIGVPGGAEVRQLEVVWPDGAVSLVERVKEGTTIKLLRSK